MPHDPNRVDATAMARELSEAAMQSRASSDSALALGPLLRHVDETSATIWVEARRRGTVSVRCGSQEFTTPTFTVHGHHYALVEVTGLQPGTSTAYTVAIDGDPVWPPPESAFPASRIRTLDPAAPLRIVFGSCRTSVPHDAAANRQHGVDVLRAYALRMADLPDSEWPGLVMFLGDQVYADETSEEMREFIASRRDITQPPKEELKDFEEYAHLYSLAWSDPANRWLLSTLPTAMVFDDHDIRDDWNTSLTWRQQIGALPWWRDRIVGGLGSYWVYQHLGNLSRKELAEDDLFTEVRKVGEHGDAGDLVDAFAEEADASPHGKRWSYARDIGRVRVIVLDSRCGRVLTPDERSMLDEDEMAWFDDLATGDVDHLLIGTSLPFLLPVGLHHLEAWDESVSEGAWGRRLSGLGEKLRQGVDLEHWAAFENSFRRVSEIVLEVADGRRGRPPATVTFLSGDVHHSYLAQVQRPRTAGTRIVQAVCSPIRNPLPRAVRFAMATASYGLAWPLGRLAARSATVPDPPLKWRITDGPWFDNMLASLDFDGPSARLTWESARAKGDEEPGLHTVHAMQVSDSVALA